MNFEMNHLSSVINANEGIIQSMAGILEPVVLFLKTVAKGTAPMHFGRIREHPVTIRDPYVEGTYNFGWRKDERPIVHYA